MSGAIGNDDAWVRSRSARLAALALCVLYFPLAYGFVYVPFVVPRLPERNSLPMSVLLGLGLPFVAMAVVFGAASTQRVLVPGVVGIAAANAVAVGVAANAGWPGFHETVAPFMETMPVVFVAVGAGALVLGEVGFALRRLLGGPSQKPHASERV